MKIENLSLVNFGNHANSNLALEQINFIQGQNNSGKTLVIDAIRWVLQGYCRNMKNSSDRTGEIDLIRLHSNDKIDVALTFNKDNKQFRLLKHRTKSAVTLHLQDVENKKPIKQEDVFKLINCDEKQITAVLDSMKGFLELEGKGRKQLLFDLLGVSLNEQLIKEHLIQHDISEPFLTKVTEVIINDGFKAALDKAVEKRKEFKRQLADLTLNKPTDKKIFFEQKEVNISGLEPDKVQAAFDKLKDERDSLLKKSGNLEATEKGDLIKLDQRKMLLIPEIETAQSELDDFLKSNQPVDDKELTVFNDSISDHEAQIRKTSELIIKLKYAVDQFAKQISEIEQLGDKCPKCNSQLTAAIKQKIVSDIQKDMIKKQAEYDVEIKNEKSLRDNLKSINEKLTKLKEFSDTKKQYEGALERLQAERNMLNLQIKTAKSSNVAKENLIKVQEDLEGNKQILAEMESLLNEVKTYQFNLSVYNNNSGKQEKFDEAIKIYDKLAKLLAPDGIINDILKSVIGKFQKRIDTVNSILPEIKIDANDLTFNFGHKTEAMLDKRGSEWQRLSWLISEAIAFFSGLKIWLIDRVDILDDKNKRDLLKLLQNVKGDYETIIVTGTKDQRPEIATNNGVKFFWVADGVVK